MSTDDGKKKPQGFATFSPEKLLEAQRKGGSAKVPTKGSGSLSPEARREKASKAASARWQRVKEQRLEAESNVVGTNDNLEGKNSQS